MLAPRSDTGPDWEYPGPASGVRAGPSTSAFGHPASPQCTHRGGLVTTGNQRPHRRLDASLFSRRTSFARSIDGDDAAQPEQDDARFGHYHQLVDAVIELG